MFDDDPRWGNDPRERHDDSRERDAVDLWDVFADKLDLPRGPERELVHDRDREYTLRGSESRTLTLHYRGAHGAAAGRSGFSTFRGSSGRTGGVSFNPDYASEFVR